MTITQSSTRFVAIVAGFALALSLMVGAFAATAPAQAAALTQAQISAIISLLQSFGADAQTVANVTASLNGQATGGSTGGSVSVSCSFSRSLTMGSSGADVTCLQQGLIAMGYSIPAGATGFFGTQTQTAVASWQAAHNITPAAGYFGPISQAAWATMTVPPTGGGGTTPPVTGGLKGGEADLTNYDLVSEEGTFGQGDSNVKVATAEFDVDGGDVSVQRVDLEVQATVTTGSPAPDVKPWKYMDTITVWDGSTKVGSVDASDQDNWDDSTADSDHNPAGSPDAKVYKISITGINDIVREGDTANLTFAVTAQDTIDTDNETQSFNIDVPDNGIRAVDAAGIQQYTGDVSDNVSVDIDEAQNGDLSVKLDSSNPDASVLVADDTSTSDEFDVLAFDVKNTDDADAKVTDLTVTVATSSSAGPDTDITDIIRKATLDFGGKTYDGDINSDNTITFTDMEAIVGGNDTEKGVLSVTLYGQTGHFAASGQALTFKIVNADSDLTAEGADSGDSLGNNDKSGSAIGKQQSIAISGGISVSGDHSDNTVVTGQSDSGNAATAYGTFTVKFDVTAVGDDVYIPRGAGLGIATTTTDNASSTSHFGVVVDPSVSDTAPTAGGAVTASLSSTAEIDPSNSMFYVVHDGDTETFTATVRIDPTTTGFYQVGLDKIRFTTDDSNLNSLQVLNVDQNDAQFNTEPASIANS